MCKENDYLQGQLSGFEVDDGRVRRRLQLEDLPLKEWLESLLLWQSLEWGRQWLIAKDGGRIVRIGNSRKSSLPAQAIKAIKPLGARLKA